MEHKKKNTFKIVMQIAWSEYIRWICNPRMIIVIALVFFLEGYAIEPLMERAQEMNTDLQSAEPFLAIGNSMLLCYVLPSVFLCLISDFPKINGNTLFFVSRVGRYAWYGGQLIAGILCAFSYLLMILGSCFFLTFSRIRFSNQWSEVITKYYKLHADAREDYVSQFITGRLYNNFLPNEAFFYTFALLLAFLVLLILLKMAGFLWGNSTAGIAVGGAMIAIGGALNVVDTKLKWVFPMAHALEWQHCDEVLNVMEVSIQQSYFYFLIFSLILIILEIWRLEKFNF